MSASTASRDELKQVIEVDVKDNSSSSKQPALASKLEKEAEELKKKRQSLSKEDVENKLKEAEERRQRELSSRIEKAKELEGTKGEVNKEAAAKDAPPQGREIANSPH